MPGSEDKRYVEYLQRQLQREGSEQYFAGHKAWFDSNRVSLAEQYRSLNLAKDSSAGGLAQALLDHTGQGPHEDFFASQIFEPLLQKALRICRKGNIAPKLPVRFANSPGFEPSPAAVPSTVEHLLFAGQGTFAFCNYWAKVFSSAIAEVGSLPRMQRRSPKAAIAKLREGKTLSDATRLALRYALTDSLVGFGRIEQPKELHASRVLLINAMEIFIVGHEIGHFTSHEKGPESSGGLSPSESRALEFECDAVGLAVSTVYGQDENNAFAFQLIGAVLFFYALRIGEQAKAIILNAETPMSDSHPSAEERIRFALTFLGGVGAHKRIRDSVNFALDIAMYVGSQVQVTLRAIKRENGEC